MSSAQPARRPISVEEFEAFSALFGGNAVFVEELYARFLENPNGVDESWRNLFRDLHDDARIARQNLAKGSWAQHQSQVIGARDAEELPSKAANANKKQPASEEALQQVSFESVRALMLIRTYRVRGHLHANLDPLGLEARKPHPELDPASYGFTEADWDKEIYIHGVLGRQKATLREIMELLNRTYCGTMGVEFMHIQSPEQKAWIQSRIEERQGNFNLSPEEKRFTLQQLVEVESFENFLQLKFPSMKRFSVQGGDPMVPGLEMAIRTAAEGGIEDINIGMPHRGRMNVLTTVMKKPFMELFSLFHGNLDYPEGVESSGDVKYHLGTSTDRDFGSKKTHMTLAANPSHLEAVDPVVLGRVRAKQDLKQDSDRTRCMGILLHGDAAYAGQGLVAEVHSLSQLDAYKTGGTLHMVVNNQIGFTTNPKSGRSSPYSTDVAKMVGAPILHINGDDPEAVVFGCKLAAEFILAFRCDVVVDIICYRKYGHNESDEPMFTQPRMYKEIRQHTLPATMYGQRLVAEGSVTKAEVDALFEQYRERFDKEFEDARSFRPNAADWLQGQWSGFSRPDGEHPDVDTGVDAKQLKEIGLSLASYPEGYEINSKILRQLDAKKEMMESGKDLDWAMGEALAFGSLLKQGYPVRMTGQDVERGTFSHRHAVLTDQSDERKYTPLNHLSDSQAKLQIFNSNLSEFAVLGFEYGYSQASPNTLTLWEAQFGDFVNGAQVIIDQFISSAEMKWLRMSGLVMLLPHGYEGQGPEHSSARLERFLQMCAQDNMQVANCSTPANYFHILRRQLLRNFRKPLIMMSPKSLLRHKLCVSTLAEMGKGTQFQPVLGEVDKLGKKIRRVVITSGKVYYDLLEARREKKQDDVAILRLEQYYPFPVKKLAEALKPYKDAEVVWCQEEPKNMGAWSFVSPLIEEVLLGLKTKQTRPAYAGRPAAASPACGYLKMHTKEQQKLVAEALA